MFQDIHHLIATYGYLGVGLVVGLESMGIPLPGETALISAALYAGTTHHMSIFGVIAAAAAGAVIGDNIGYAIGHRLGLPFLVRIGPRLGISEGKFKLGRYLFARYGIAVVFFGRFVAVLRTLAALLAGVNQMPWAAFFGANLSGAVVWAGCYGMAAYLAGRQIHKLVGPVGIAMLVVAAIVILVGILLLRRNEQRLQEIAEAEFPGPITGHPKR